MTTQAERLAVVETEVKALGTAFEDHKQKTTEEFDKVNHKLDDLLALKHKGMGAFWLAASVVGSSIWGLVITFFTYIRGS